MKTNAAARIRRRTNWIASKVGPVIDPFWCLQPHQSRCSAAFASHCLPHRRSDLLRIELDRRSIIARQDEPGDAVLERDHGQFADPLLRWPLQQAAGRRREAATDVEQPTDGAWVATGSIRSLIDVIVHAGQFGRSTLQVPQGWQPAVARPAGHAQDARLVGAHPDADVVGGPGAALGALHGVVLADELHAARLVHVPDLADDADALLERFDRLAGALPFATHGDDGVPEPAGPEAELETTTAEKVQAGRAASKQGGVPQREVVNVGAQADALRTGGDEGQQ